MSKNGEKSFSFGPRVVFGGVDGGGAGGVAGGFVGGIAFRSRRVGFGSFRVKNRW